MKRIWILILAIVGGFSAVQAKADVVRCAQCSSVTMMQREAASEGDGSHIVYSYRHALISAWTVNVVGPKRRDKDVGEPTISATQAPVPADILAAFEALVPVYDATGGTMRMAAEIDLLEIGLDGRYGDAGAYTFLRDYSMRRAIGDAIVDNIIGITGRDVISEAGEKYIGSFARPLLTVTLVFNNGSTVRYEAAPVGYGEYAVEYNNDSSRSSSGAPIPEDNTAEYQGSYDLGSFEEARRFIDHIRGLGGTFTGGGAGVRTIGCTWTSGPSGAGTLGCRPN